MPVHMQLLHECPDDALLAELRRHRRSLCRALDRPRFADAAGSMDSDALPLMAVALLSAGGAASQSMASQLEVLQVVPVRQHLCTLWQCESTVIRFYRLIGLYSLEFTGTILSPA